MFKDIKKYDEKVEKEIIYEIWFSMIKLKYEERVKLLYKYGNSRNIYNLCNLTKFKRKNYLTYCNCHTMCLELL